MLRMFLYLLAIAALGAGAAWLADRPGELVITWLGYRIETSVFAAGVLLIVAFALLMLFWFGAHKLLTAPKRMVKAMRERREQRGREALRLGIFAVGAGDATLAARYASEASRALTDEPLTKLLRAQTAQLTGDYATARRVFESMLEAPDTKLLGLHGLFLEARRENQIEAAEQFAARAMTTNPALPWASEALFELQCRKSDWAGALTTLATMRQHKLIDRKDANRRRAVLLTAQAQELESTDQERAGQLAQEAHRLAPDLVPAAEIGGRVLAAQGYTSRAAKILARTWELSPHPDIALTYAYARPGDSPRDRLARVRNLTRKTPDYPEARMALAAAAIDAHEWGEARLALEPLLSGRPTRRVCTLMARIEAGENRDAGRVREWLARALRAARDAAWVADGVVSDRWAPTSPVTGKLDAFQWRVPVERIALSESETLSAEIAELDKLEPLPAEELGVAAKQVAPRTAEQPTVPAPTEQTPESQAAAPADLELSAREENAEAAKEPKPETPSKAEVVPAAKQSAQPPASTHEAAVIQPDTSALEVPRDRAPTHLREVTTQAPAEPASPVPVPPASVPSGQKTLPATKKREEPRIFVPERPPDDPGPEPLDPDEVPDPLTRFRMPAKSSG